MKRLRLCITLFLVKIGYFMCRWSLPVAWSVSHSIRAGLHVKLSPYYKCVFCLKQPASILCCWGPFRFFWIWRIIIRNFDLGGELLPGALLSAKLKTEAVSGIKRQIYSASSILSLLCQITICQKPKNTDEQVNPCNHHFGLHFCLTPVGKVTN